MSLHPLVTIINLLVNLLEGEGDNLETKFLAKLQKHSSKTLAVALSSKHIFPSLLRHMCEIVPFLEGRSKDFRAFHNSFASKYFLNFFFIKLAFVLFY